MDTRQNLSDLELSLDELGQRYKAVYSENHLGGYKISTWGGFRRRRYRSPKEGEFEVNGFKSPRQLDVVYTPDDNIRAAKAVFREGAIDLATYLGMIIGDSVMGYNLIDFADGDTKSLGIGISFDLQRKNSEVALVQNILYTSLGPDIVMVYSCYPGQINFVLDLLNVEKAGINFGVMEEMKDFIRQHRSLTGISFNYNDDKRIVNVSLPLSIPYSKYDEISNIVKEDINWLNLPRTHPILKYSSNIVQ